MLFRLTTIHAWLLSFIITSQFVHHHADQTLHSWFFGYSCDVQSLKCDLKATNLCTKPSMALVFCTSTWAGILKSKLIAWFELTKSRKELKASFEIDQKLWNWEHPIEHGPLPIATLLSVHMMHVHAICSIARGTHKALFVALYNECTLHKHHSGVWNGTQQLACRKQQRQPIGLIICTELITHSR